MAVSSQKQRLLAATDHLLRRHGLARVTTRDIAQRARVAEGSLYHHFGDKAELIIDVALHGVGEYRAVLENLPLQIGRQSVQKNLERVLQSAFEFYYRIAPMFCSLFADQKLLARTRRIMNERKLGPARSIYVLTTYLRAEQRLGRVAAASRPDTVAELMIAASFNMALQMQFHGRKLNAAATRRATREAVRSFLVGLAPSAAERGKYRPGIEARA